MWEWGSYRHNIAHKEYLLRSPFSPNVTLLGDRELDTLALGQRYPRLGALTDDENVRHPGSECSIQGILNVNNIESSDVLLPVYNNTNTTHVTTTRHHNNVTSVELDKVDDFVLFKIELDSVVDLDEGIGIPDGSAIVGDNMRDTTGTESDLADFEEFVAGLLGSDAVDREATLDVVEQTEVLARLLDGNDILEASRVGGVSAHFSVNFNEALHDDSSDFTASEGIL